MTNPFVSGCSIRLFSDWLWFCGFTTAPHPLVVYLFSANDQHLHNWLSGLKCASMVLLRIHMCDYWSNLYSFQRTAIVLSNVCYIIQRGRWGFIIFSVEMAHGKQWMMQQGGISVKTLHHLYLLVRPQHHPFLSGWQSFGEFFHYKIVNHKNVAWFSHAGSQMWHSDIVFCVRLRLSPIVWKHFINNETQEWTEFRGLFSTPTIQTVLDGEKSWAHRYSCCHCAVLRWSESFS